MSGFQFCALIILGLAVLGASLSSYVAKLKPVQAGGLLVGIGLLLLAILPPGKWSVGGYSYEPLAAAKAADTVATNRQLDALAQRLRTIEAKFAVLSSAASTPEQRQRVSQADAAAAKRYDEAAATARRARSTYLQALSLQPRPVTPTGCALLAESGQPLVTEDGRPILSEDCGPQK